MTASKDLLEGWKALEDATDRFEEAMAYYRGTAGERFANARIRELVERTGQSYAFRLAAVPVKVMAKRCRIANVTSDSEQVTARLAEIREANQAELHEPHLIRRTLIYGDAYALVWPVESGEADVDQEDGAGSEVAAPEVMEQVGVEISYQSPLHCRIVYDSEDGRRPRFGIRRWKVASPISEGLSYWRAEVWYHDRVEPWRTSDGASGGSPEEWRPFAEDEDGTELLVEEGVNWPLEHDWDEIPIKHARTDLPYGEPVHAAAYAPQDAITKAITTQVVVDIEAHGWRERYRLLDDQKSLETGREPVNWGDAADAPAVVQGLPEESGRRRGSGMEHIFAGTRAVGEFTAPDPGLLIKPIDQWIQLMSVVTETPLDELNPTVQLSGVSREKADAPMKAKERDLKLYLSAFWREVYALAVRMSGMPEPGAIDVQWAPPDVTMDSDWWVTAQARVNLGVPVARILTEANYLPEDVKAWLDGQGEEMALMQRIAVLERLGAAVQSLGVGIQLGVLDQATVSSLITRITGEVQSADSGD